MNCNENGKLCKCGHPESAHELNHASRRGPCEASAAANSYSLCRCLRFVERATRVAEAAEPAVPVAREAGWHEPDCVDHGNCHCEAERPLKKALASAANLRQLYRDTLDSRTRLAGLLATVEWQRDAAVKARNEAEDRAEMDQRGFAACSAELESVREALTAEKERAERLENELAETRGAMREHEVFIQGFRAARAGDCRAPHEAYQDWRDGGRLPSVATGERAIVVGSRVHRKRRHGTVRRIEKERVGIVVEWDGGASSRYAADELDLLPPATPEPGGRETTMSACSACNGSGWKAGKWTAEREVCPECRGSNEPAEKTWQVLSRDADGDDEWEVNDPGPYTRADADRRVEMWSISSSIYRFKTARIPTPTPLTESGNEP